MAKPNLPDIKTFIQAGIDPKTRLPVKFESKNKAALKENTKMFLRLIVFIC